ncbi:MAG: nicotinate-nucleotide adenylyltransferase [Candidatus Latescibacterota bacterium]|jgi:nicotinate-nucleotide adenylyltransferase
MTGRVGIFGGTFDPIHMGHLLVGQEVFLQCQLDHMVFMPSGIPPHKQYEGLASSQDRAEMVRLALQGSEKFEVSFFELERSGKSYTVETLHALRKELGPGVDLFLIIGADNAVDMRSWYNPEAVLDLAQVLVAERPGFDRNRIDPVLKAKMQFVKTPLLEISSTEIRKRVQIGSPIRYWVPDAVAEYVFAHNLYQ